jgi:AcrR family transcriptional regulator
MKLTPKLTCDERRAAIIRAVREVFAEKGFHGTTTRALAEAAGVSEALLFKHFPNKESLYSAMMLSFCEDQCAVAIAQLNSLEPSASSLVCLVHGLVSHLIAPRSERDEEEKLKKRLVLRSLTEDGEFARMFFEARVSRWIRKAEECLSAAIAAGEAVEGPVRPKLGAIFVHHLAGMVVLHLRPTKPVTDYEMPPNELVQQVVWFTLRGIGLKEDTIRRHYNPKALDMLAN